MMKKLETIKDKLETITQSYLGMNPGDKKCGSWGEMQRKMVGEIMEALQERPEEMYYIQNGYVGNSILWWGKNFAGYTTHFLNAGKYSKDEAIEIINNESRDDCAWLCSHVDNSKDVHVLTVEVDNLDQDFRLTGEKK